MVFRIILHKVGFQCSGDGLAGSGRGTKGVEGSSGDIFAGRNCWPAHGQTTKEDVEKEMDHKSKIRRQ